MNLLACSLAYRYHTIRGFVSLASAKTCSVLGFGRIDPCGICLDLDVVVRPLGLPSSLGGLGERLLQEMNMRLIWTGTPLVLSGNGNIGYTIGSGPGEEK